MYYLNIYDSVFECITAKNPNYIFLWDMLAFVVIEMRALNLQLIRN